MRFNVTGFQLDPMPRGIGIEEKQKELFAAISNQITALPNAISHKIKWAQKILPVQFFPCHILSYLTIV